MLDKATFTPHGRHLIAGEWVAGETTFRSEPATGEAHAFSVGTPALVDRAAEAAEEAFWSYGYASREERAAFLDRIADEIEARAEAITAIGSAETGLPAARLEGERGRTVGQLRLFAKHIRKGDYLDRRHDVGAARPQADAAARSHDDPAADRPGRGIRRLEFPARLLDGRRRHRRGARRRLPGDRQGPLGASGHRRDRRGGDPCRDSGHAASTPASSA